MLKICTMWTIYLFNVAVNHRSDMENNPFEPLDKKKLGSFHLKSMLTTGLGVFTDGYDLSSIGIVLPLVIASFGIKSLTGFQSSMLVASALIGATFGALIFGALSNLGRKRFYGLDVLLMGIGAILQIFVSTPNELIAVRFLLGIGVGADYVLSPMIMGEHSNAKDRGKIMALGFGLLWGFGATAAGAVYLGLVPFVSGAIVWRIVLAAGAIPALAVIYYRRKMPETARYLGRIKGDSKETESVIREITGNDERIPRGIRDTKGLKYYLRTHGKMFLAACSLWFLFDMVAYAGILFGTSLIAGGLGLNPGEFQFLVEFLFVIPGGLIALSFIDRKGRRKMQIAGFIGMGISLVVFGAYTGITAMMIPAIGLSLFGGMEFFSQAGPGSVSASGVLGVELSPTKVRGTIQSLTVASGRLGAVISAFVFPSLFSAYGETFALYFLAGIAVAAAAITFIFIPETGSKSLEESSVEEDTLISEIREAEGRIAWSSGAEKQ